MKTSVHSVQSLNVECEKAIRMLAVHVPPSDETSRKPALVHAIRVGVYLYERNYSRDVVIAGFLHDALEWSSITENMLRDEFGEQVLDLVRACTKNDSIKDPKEKIDELIARCAKAGESALIIKAADIIDSFKYYSKVQNSGELEYCRMNAHAIHRLKPHSFTDSIFEELKI